MSGADPVGGADPVSVSSERRAAPPRGQALRVEFDYIIVSPVPEAASENPQEGP